jgi:ribosomal protein S18 acetylase RimI-like enzyme
MSNVTLRDSLEVVSSAAQPDTARRARAWRDSVHAAICDVLEPWEHGTIARATRYPSYFDFNVVRVEEDPEMSADELEAFADHALHGLDHRKLDFDVVDAGESLRADFEAKGWMVNPLIWMRHSAPLPPGPEVSLEDVPYDAVQDLRVIWHREDFGDLDAAGYHAEAKEVAMRCGVHALALRERGEPVAFAELERDGATAEITSVFVHPDYRGAGRGTAVTRAAIEVAADADDIWIVADAEGRAKDIYARLGFRPAWRALELLRLPMPRP